MYAFVRRRTERTYGPGAGLVVHIRAALGAVLAYDSFTRTNGAIGSTEATGPAGESLTPQEHEAISNTAVVASNAATSAGANVALVRLSAGTFAQDISVSVVAGSTNGTGPIVRFGALTDYVKFTLTSDGAWTLVRRVGGSNTTMAAGSGVGASAVLRLRALGTNYKAYINGRLVADVIYSSGRLNENDMVGWQVDGTSSTVDNFTVRAVA